MPFRLRSPLFLLLVAGLGGVICETSDRGTPAVPAPIVAVDAAFVELVVGTASVASAGGVGGEGGAGTSSVSTATAGSR